MFVQTVPGQTSTKVKMTVFIWQTAPAQMFVQNDSLHMAYCTSLNFCESQNDSLHMANCTSPNFCKCQITVFILQTVPAQTFTSMKVKMTVFIQQTVPAQISMKVKMTVLIWQTVPLPAKPPQRSKWQSSYGKLYQPKLPWRSKWQSSSQAAIVYIVLWSNWNRPICVAYITHE